MAHPEQVQFCLGIKEKFKDKFEDANVLDVGSLDINGSNRYLFWNNCKYTGIDIAPGNNVDIVSLGHEHNASDNEYDIIISTECFEHDKHWDKTLSNIVRMLKSNGLFFFTCATTGRAEHGTARSEPMTSPLTVSVEDWKNYYRNITEQDVRSIMNVDKIFSEFKFSVDDGHHDLQFWGIKK